jgi:glycosyltransferase involved in cell wall biosynthesis
VDTELFKPSEDRRENKMFTVTYAGAFQKWQGIENLVEAAYLLKDAEVKFKMIGFRETDYAFREEIRRRLKDEADLIDFLPNQPPALIDHLRNSDILIIPRLWVPGTSKYSNIQLLRETFGWFPTKFAEYIATGRPVIVTSLDVSAELVGRYDCGFVCDPAPAAIAQTILQARDTPKESLDEKGMNGRRLAEAEFDLKVTGKKYFEFLSGIA